MLPLFIDIDGTLTTEPERQWGPPIRSRVDWVRGQLLEGKVIVLWSGGGMAYAKAFAAKYALDRAVCLGKPSVIVDDNPTIRPRDRMKIVDPAEFFSDLDR